MLKAIATVRCLTNQEGPSVRNSQRKSRDGSLYSSNILNLYTTWWQEGDIYAWSCSFVGKWGYLDIIQKKTCLRQLLVPRHCKIFKNSVYRTQSSICAQTLHLYYIWVQASRMAHGAPFFFFMAMSLEACEIANSSVFLNSEIQVLFFLETLVKLRLVSLRMKTYGSKSVSSVHGRITIYAISQSAVLWMTVLNTDLLTVT